MPTMASTIIRIIETMSAEPRSCVLWTKRIGWPLEDERVLRAEVGGRDGHRAEEPPVLAERHRGEVVAVLDRGAAVRRRRRVAEPDGGLGDVLPQRAHGKADADAADVGGVKVVANRVGI